MGRSEELFEEAVKLIPGGVNSPVRAFRAVGGVPRFAVRGQGAWIEDVDGRRYVDYVQSWGALLFGHARAEVVHAAVQAAGRGTSFGAPTELEVRLAKMIVSMVPSVEEVRLVSSGTEACMSAVRLARGATGRDKVVKFDGCYHGHADALLAEAGSGVATLGLPGTKGVTAGAAGDTVVVPYNDLAAVKEAFTRHGEEIACVIVEPVAANMGVVVPEPGFLQSLRRLTIDHGAVLIFDEVITGFRVAQGGAQQLFDVIPDLTTLGKVMGGGFPCAAFGGRRDLMEQLAPAGPVYQAGTLSGNPVAVAAGLAALDLCLEIDPYPDLTRRGQRLASGLQQILGAAGVPTTINRMESLFSVFFGEDRPVRTYQAARSADHDRYARFFRAVLAEGVYLPPSGYEAWFLSTAHGDEEIDRTLEAVERAAGAIG
jgi:glutamate-1-semialdehyde 2,1-aminomutase